MNILLTGSKTIGQVQDEFQTAYPCLNLAFFRRPHHAHRSPRP